jgi:beta-phosphoglucomutase
MADIRAIVFDFDGVLANSEPLHLRAYQAVLGEHGLTLGRDEYYQQYIGFDDVTALRTLSERRGLGWTEPHIAGLVTRKTVFMEEILGTDDVLYPEAVACVERLGAALPLGIASGALRHEIQAILRRAGLEHHFKFIVAAGDTKYSKPAPDPYRRAARLHELPPEQCVAIEDSRWGIESAKDAGLHCVGITQTYAARELPGADAIIGSLDEFTVELLRKL